MAASHHQQKRRGQSAGRRNAACGPGRPNGFKPGHKPVYAYQRRIDSLGLRPKVNQLFRQDWLESVMLAFAEGLISIGAVAVAKLLARESNSFGADINVPGAKDSKGRDRKIWTEAEIGAACFKVNRSTYSATWASARLDELYDAKLLTWQHGSSAQRNDPARRQRLNGRWQGPSQYRLLIRDADRAAIDARRAQKRTSDRAERNAKNLPSRDRRDFTPGERKDRGRALDIAAQAAVQANTFDEAVTLMAAELYDLGLSRLHELAYQDLEDRWAARTAPS